MSIQAFAIVPAVDIDWTTPVDRSRWFFCETLTPLYYTPIYRELGADHRRRYNQLTGLLTSELIALLETEFLHAALDAVRSSGAPDPELRAAIERFAADERRHAEIWQRLNHLSEPDWYARAPNHVVSLPSHAGGLLRFIARYPVAFPVVFWVQLVQEERSVDISRRCMRVPPERMEPRFAAAFAAHVRDEARHVQIDRRLIDRFYAGRSMVVRRITARLFRAITKSFLLIPSRSTARVVQLLAAEYPELRPILPRIGEQLRALEHSDAYHEMMYSRRSTPVTFSLFDRYEEFHQMHHVLRAYRPPAAAPRSVSCEGRR